MILPPLRCFQGVIPAAIATASADGVPNVTYLSQVFRVDDEHVALSCQFFNKTQRNIAENPCACIQLYDPVTFEAYRLTLRFERSETSGPLFDVMAMRIQVIASHTGMAGVFALRSADVYVIESCERLEGFIDVPALPALDDPGGRNELRALQVVSQRAARATDLPTLIDDVLESLELTLGCSNGMVLVPDESGETLRVVGSRGYPATMLGLEIARGQGAVGMVAEERRMLRVCGLREELRYGRAIRDELVRGEGPGALTTEVPLCGLPDAQSQVILPLLSADRLVGVLVLESRDRLGFDEWDEAFLEIVANQVAVCVDRLRETWRQSPEDLVAPRPDPDRVTRRFCFYPHDDCVFVDDAYLIRNVPGRILWKLLRMHA
ncbi:MAG: GAF domain-containing protein, partial [Polyangiaceae bacterium]